MTGPAENDTSYRAETPEGIEYTLYPAGICARFCAYLIDTLIKWIGLTVFYFIFAIFLRGTGGFWILLLVYFVMDWFYHVFFDLFFRGQSPGKRVLGLRVVQSDGSPVSAGASFIRNLLRFVDGYIGLYLIAFLSASASEAFRRPGDWAAG
ncbi:MAG: RDD family protein, partial [Treponema sp.]|nr:RDD family protein [Treponema sp.]